MGRYDEFLGKLQERYGYKKDDAEREVDDFLRTMAGYGGMVAGWLGSWLSVRERLTEER